MIRTACLVLPGLALQAAVPGAVYGGEPEAEIRLAPWVEGAFRSTEAFGPWPEGPWTIQVHGSDATFEAATGAPPGRSALWVGSTLHLRPWERLQRRDLGALLRHELAHRRLAARNLPRWKEEAACLWAEGHTRPPDPWPVDPGPDLQRRLDSALASGTTASQCWAYAWLRAWLGGRPLPPPPSPVTPPAEPWRAEGQEDRVDRPVRVVWPPERLPRSIQVNGQDHAWKPGTRFRFEGDVRFGEDMPVARLEGPVELEAVPSGWRLTWTADAGTWIAAATEGELGAEAPFEAKRALAAVLRRWLAGRPRGNHLDGTLCPLTHCAVVRGQPGEGAQKAVAAAPALDIDPARACFTGSKGGVSLSPREVWGRGSTVAGSAQAVPGDPWASWTRRLTAAQVKVLKASVKPGLRPGQRGLRLGASGPHAVESLRLEAGRQFGWTAWPSNACEVEMQPDGSAVLRGRGWGHNVGLCLATAVHRAGQGDPAEAILREAFGEENP